MQTVPPAVEPLSLDEAKAHLRVEHAEEDDLIERLIAAARETVERQTGRALITQGFACWLDAWPAPVHGRISVELPRPPLQSVESVTLYDTADAEHEIVPENYVVDLASSSGRIVLKSLTGLNPVLRAANAIAVAFTAGFGDAGEDVPEPLRQAVRLLAAHYYENREAANGNGALPLSVEALLRPYRVVQL